MTLPYTDPSLPAAANPYFQDNAFVRGDQQRANNGFIWANEQSLDTRVTALEVASPLVRGFINGGLLFNTINLPPTIYSGIYEVNGTLITKTSNTTLALANVLGQGRPILDSSTKFLIVMDSSGNCSWLLYGEGQVASGTISSITGASTTKTLTKATGTVGSHTNKILVIYGNNGFAVGTYKITGGNGSTTYTFEGPSGTVGGASGTWQVYDVINTLHGTGTSTPITGVNSAPYTPSYGENVWSAGIANFDTTRNGFYLTIPGYTNLRVIGNGAVNGSTFVTTNIVSHKSGRNKNDNFFSCYRQPIGYGATDNRIVRWDANYFDNIRGCDYLMNDNSLNGTIWTMFRNLDITLGYVYQVTGSSYFGITIDSLALSTAIETITDLTLKALSYGQNTLPNIICLYNGEIYCNNIIRCHTDGATPSPITGYGRLNFKMEVM